MLLQTPTKAPEISVTRQPIYDKDENTFAYELQFRNSDAEFSSINDSDPASSQIIANVFMEIGLKLFVGDKLAFIKIPHHFLIENHSIPFAKNKFILEIRDSEKIDENLLESITGLNTEGFTIALDEFNYKEPKRELIEQCALIKIDITGTSKETLSALVSKLKPLGKLVLAKKVDNQEDFELCKEIGFTYFQGSFLSEPRIVKYKTLSSNKLLLLELLAKTQSPDTDINELEELIEKDVGISFKFLRLINSANFGLSQKVESLHQALMLLGMKEIKSWISLAALSNIDSVPQELTDMSIFRARMCKQLAKKANLENTDAFFTIGMFSLLDVLMSKPMKHILRSLPFPDDINEALLFHKGPMGKALDCVIAHEQSDWNMIKFENLSPAEINEIYIDTLEWSRNVKQQFS